MSGGAQSWGRHPQVHHAAERRVSWPGPRCLAGGVPPYLAYGLGRSYGDSCLNDGGTLLLTRRLDRFLRFDPEAAELECEAGVSLAEILAITIPRGFTLPVVPGTKFVTVGGAIANDVHGKNHHRAGTFGRHVLGLELVRSDGTSVRCSPRERPELFAATVGGLGLTGLIVSARVALRRIATSAISAETVPLTDLEAFFDTSQAADEAFEYTVAWVDCLATGRRLGRGILHRGNLGLEAGPLRTPAATPRLRVPVELPCSPLNRWTVAAFNAAYHAYHRRAGAHTAHPDAFFFPLDGVGAWNRIYGRRGFVQFQCVVPGDAARSGIRACLEVTSRARAGSFLAVLKTFGALPSPGLLSFPRPGATLALDFPWRGAPTLALLRELHAVVAHHGGAIYPAKDAHMSPAQFRGQWPAERLVAFERERDPAFSSTLWRRVSL